MTILISLSKPLVFLPESMMFFIPRLIRLAVSIGRMCMTQVHSRPYSITISQQSLDLSRFSSLSRPICLCQSIQTVLSYIFHPNRSFFHPYQTSSHLHPDAIKKMYLFLTVQPRSHPHLFLKNHVISSFFTSSPWSALPLHPRYSPA